MAAGSEGGGSAKAFGVDTVLTGVMPPPGTLRLTTFLSYYEANQTLDGNGDPRPGISNFRLTAGAATLRFQYVWPDAKLWGADLETRLGFTAYLDPKVQFDVQTPAGSVHKQSSASGTGDALFGPLLLGWHGDSVHQITGFEFFLPTGHFNPSKLANLSRGYYSIAPAYWVTWFPNDNVEIGSNIFYLYNYKNPDTNYQTGQEVAIDYALGYAVTPVWQAGVSGYYYQQVTDDKLNGQDVAGGNRGRVLGIGPYIRYHPNTDFGITLKWQTETLVENRTKGNRFYLQFALKLW